jgi:hypothetical protein
MKPTIERPVIDEIYRHLTTRAKEMLVEKGHEVRPQFFLYKADGTFLAAAPENIVDKFFASDGGKTLMRTAIGAILAGDADPIAADIVAVISEAWVATGAWLDDDQIIALQNGTLKVKDMDEKREAIVVTIYTLEGTDMGFCPIITVEGGNRTVKMEPMVSRGDLSGRMVIKPTKFEVPR